MFDLRRITLVLLTLVATVVLAACDGGASQDELDRAKQEGAQQAREQAQLKELQQQIKNLQRDGNDTGTGASTGSIPSTSSGVDNGPGPDKSCEYGVLASTETTCPFALNVASEYQSNPGASTISAYSDTTGQSYTMTCAPWAGGGTVCRGGVGAAVFIP